MIVHVETVTMKIDIIKHRLNFRFEAGTSRGTMTWKDSWFLKLNHPQKRDVFGLGECGPIIGLSPDLNSNLESEIRQLVKSASEIENVSVETIDEIIASEFPALKFALETAILDLNNGGSRVIFQNDFVISKLAIPINGLVWMGDKQTMLEQIKQKIKEGFDCIKIKIGAINLEDELALLKYIRSKFSSDKITIRLDANGAFSPEEVLMILDRLSQYDIHSIEQPIEAGKWKDMERICNLSPIPIALDEELIGISGADVKVQLLADINPAYIILKPTLVGGLKQCEEWIGIAEGLGIGWWITSTLESNIGLNAIAQFVGNYSIDIPQGLGTGQLYHNNITSPLVINNGMLNYQKDKEWGLAHLK